MAVSVLFRIDGNGNIEVVDDGPSPAVVVDADGQLHAESGSSPTQAKTSTATFGAGLS